jgi:Fe-S cluster assembly iron-binding protein IscA
MALDEPKAEDEVVVNNGITFLMDKDLFEKAKPVNVDFVESSMGSGFSISSNLQFGGGNCGGSCSC